MAYGPDVATGGTPSASADSESSVAEAFNDIWDSDTNRWNSGTSGTHWLKYDLGDGNAKTVIKYYFQSHISGADFHPTAWTFEGSNNDSDWDVLDTQSGISWNPNDEKKSFTFSNTTAYRYYRIVMTVTTGNAYIIHEMDMMERSLQSPIFME